MKCTWMIPFFSLIPWIMASSGKIEYTEFKDCQPNPIPWVFTNATFKWDNETKILVINATYTKLSDNNIIYRVHIVISDCANHTNCSGKPVTWIETVDCSAENLTSDNVDGCKVAQEASELEKEKEWMTYRYGSLGVILYNFQFCIDTANIKYESNLEESQFDTESSHTETTETNSNLNLY